MAVADGVRCAGPAARAEASLCAAAQHHKHLPEEDPSQLLPWSGLPHCVWLIEINLQVVTQPGPQIWDRIPEPVSWLQKHPSCPWFRSPASLDLILSFHPLQQPVRPTVVTPHSPPPAVVSSTHCHLSHSKAPGSHHP